MLRAFSHSIRVKEKECDTNWIERSVSRNAQPFASKEEDVRTSSFNFLKMLAHPHLVLVLL